MSIQNSLGPNQGGNASALNIFSPVVLQNWPGTLFTINVLVAGSTVGAIYDATSLAGNTIAKQIAVIPEAITTHPLAYTWPTAKGIVIVPGTGQVLSIAVSQRVLEAFEGIGDPTQDKQHVAGAGKLTIAGIGDPTQDKQHVAGVGKLTIAGGGADTQDDQTVDAAGTFTGP